MLGGLDATGELYMEQPEGFIISDKTDEKLALKLKKSLYGLK